MSGAYDTGGGGRAAPAWLAESVSGAARARIKAHPAFAQAMAQSAAALVSLYSGNRLLNRVLNDRGRLLFGFFSLYLHALPEREGGGLTVSRMAALAAETGVCSRGRAKAMLALLRWGGYLAPAAAEGDRRAKPLEPTARMVALQLERWQMQYGAIAMLDPRVAELAARLSDRTVFDAVIIAFGDAFRSGYRVLDHAPLIADIADRDSGLMVLLALLVAGREGAEPPSIADLARRFHVSRAHVLQLLKDAQARDLVARDGGAGAGRLAPRGEEALADFFAAAFGLLLGSARAVLEQAAVPER
ncbi:hypothetical protein V5F38_03700 [Xanthobacter sp. V0B-10]|uniref:hypothetical protein n=1 Tax=Xanthobacter albus TaxID=3119929 RepID=UPI00372AA19C